MHLRKAVDGYPKYALAWFELGQAYLGLQKPAEAKTAYEQSVACDGKFVNPHLQLLQIAVNGKAGQSCRRCLSSGPKITAADTGPFWSLKPAKISVWRDRQRTPICWP